MKKKILVPLAEGFEMVEALTIVDVFRRADVDVDLVSVTDTTTVISSHSVPVIADKLIDVCTDQSYDLIVLPGGVPGVDNLKKSEQLKSLLIKQNMEQKLYGGICAAPAVVLESHGLLDGKNATCHPLFTDKLSNRSNVDKNVVKDKNCITSKGAGTSIEFALELLEALMGKERRREVEKGMAI